MHELDWSAYSTSGKWIDMNDEIIKTPDGDRLWKEVRTALRMYDRQRKIAKEASEKRSAISKQAWAKRKAKA